MRIVVNEETWIGQSLVDIHPLTPQRSKGWRRDKFAIPCREMQGQLGTRSWLSGRVHCLLNRRQPLQTVRTRHQFRQI